MKMKKETLFYIILNLLNFYISPIFIKDTSSAFWIMLVVIPAISFIISVFYGINKGFNIKYTLITTLIYIPSIFLFYNISAFIYIFIYAVIILLANLFGNSLKKRL